MELTRRTTLGMYNFYIALYLVVTSTLDHTLVERTRRDVYIVDLYLAEPLGMTGTWVRRPGRRRKALYVHLSCRRAMLMSPRRKRSK
jgi:hypothetical protein